MFRDKIGQTVEVYINDMVVKSKREARHIKDLQGVFEVLQQHKLRLNTNKCAFRVRASKFLGYLITNRGIEVNPKQIEAVKHLNPPSNLKELQVFIDMQAPMLTAPDAMKDLFMYLSVSDHAVSAILLRDQEVQLPLYYINKTLVDVEARYLPLKKLVLALVYATRKLPHYFQVHTVYVLTEYPL